MRTHSIIHTYMNRHGHLETRVNCHCNGATDDIARGVFEDHVRFAKNAWESGRTWNGVPVRITSIVLIDANENVLGEWTYEPKAQVAA